MSPDPVPLTTSSVVDSENNVPSTKTVQEVNVDEHGSPEDHKKRAFLKFAGLTGLGLLTYFAFPKQADALVMGSTPTSNTVGIKNAANTRIDPATEATVAGVKSQTDKLTFDGSNNLYVQAATGFSGQIENASSAIINPATEETLTTIKDQTNRFTFDGSGNLLTAGGASASVVGLKDAAGSQINPSTDDSIQYLRRIVKLMESQAVVDSGNRQRITLDSIGTGTAVTTSVPVSGTVTATVASTTVTTLGGWNQQLFQDPARTAYATGIRQNLTFS